jgi:hypothetical protein
MTWYENLSFGSKFIRDDRRTHAHPRDTTRLSFSLAYLPNCHSHFFFLPTLSFKEILCKRTTVCHVIPTRSPKNSGYVMHNGPHVWHVAGIVVVFWFCGRSGSRQCVAHRLEVVRLPLRVARKIRPWHWLTHVSQIGCSRITSYWYRAGHQMSCL